jgi:hypothetical protein
LEGEEKGREERRGEERRGEERRGEEGIPWKVRARCAVGVWWVAF